MSCKKGTKPMYNKLIKTKESIATGQIKWEKELNGNSFNWEKIYSLPFNISNDPNIHWLQYRINHYILATNHYLKKINVTDNNLCDLCKTEIETLTHLFWSCPNTKQLLSEIKEWLNRSIGISFTYSGKDIIFGIVNKIKHYEVLNLIILTLKKYIYNSKFKDKRISLFQAKFAIINMIQLEQLKAKPPEDIDVFKRLLG